MSNESNIEEQLKDVLSRIEAAKTRRNDDVRHIDTRLVAVSKTKPVEMILSAYEAGQRHFGENYPQELIAKATDARILESCADIKWHFIGHLQSNKASKVASLPNLYLIESIDSCKLASKVNESVVKSNPLNVYVQINTSLEDEKSGVHPNEIIPLCRYVIEECPKLRFLGLMTIGKYGYDTSLGPNPDFLTLLECQKRVCEELNLSQNDVELSMGMSDDYEQAVELGSSNVRVGRAIFGDRERKS